MGGVAFLYNLYKSSVVHADVRETALLTLSTLAEASVYCKNSLCRKEIFVDLTGYLMKEDTPLTLKRVSVFVLNVLVTNNKAGQTLAQATGCMDILLVLFRTTFPHTTKTTLRTANATQTLPLWASVSSALCACVCNPQNEEGQQICVAAFPIINTWLQQVSLPCMEIFRPICTFIAMTVANNPRVQESFSSSGGLGTLTFALGCLTSGPEMGLMSCQLSITICNTLTACITNNPILASGLAQYGIVAHLLPLLAHPNLDCDDKLAVLLTLGHCTEASEEHQSQLVQCLGLPFILTLLTDDPNEEVRKAATFILQTCKQTVMHLGMPSVMQSEAEEVKPLADMEVSTCSARELLHRIELLEKRQAQAAKLEWPEWQRSPTSAEELGPPSVPSISSYPLPQRRNLNTIPPAYTQSSMLKHVETQRDKSMKLLDVTDIVRDQNETESSDASRCRENAKTSREKLVQSMDRGGGDLSCQIPSLEGDRDTYIPYSHPPQPPEPPKCDAPKMSIHSRAELQSRSRKLENKPMEDCSLSHFRCAGCMLLFEEVTSRTFEYLLSSCCQRCDLHQDLIEATERFLSQRRRSSLEQERPDNIAHSKAESLPAAVPRRSWEHFKVAKEFSLTPIHKGSGQAKHTQQRRHRGVILTPLRGGADPLHSYNKAAKEEERL